MKTTEEVFEDHLQKRAAGKVEADIETNYADDVIVLTGTGIFRGHQGVRDSAAELSHYLGRGEFDYRNKLVEGDYAFLEWQGKSGGRRVCDGADSFVVRDDKIVMQSIHYTVTETLKDTNSG